MSTDKDTSRTNRYSSPDGTSAKELLDMNPDRKEGYVTRTIEHQTAKIPSIVYLTLAVSSMALSLGLALRSERKDAANFVGLWAPSFLLLGLYNKIVKTHGSDIEEKQHLH